MLKQRIQGDMKAAMKSGDKRKLGAIRLILAAVKQVEVDSRTDVWGLGALLHALITGRPPLEGSGDALRRAAADGQYAPLPESGGSYQPSPEHIKMLQGLGYIS